MASSNPNPNSNTQFPPALVLQNGFDLDSLQRTTFVQADPSTFRAVVQMLTGSAPKSEKVQDFVSSRHIRKLKFLEKDLLTSSALELNERRQTTRKLDIKLNNYIDNTDGSLMVHSSARHGASIFGFDADRVMASPVSTLELMKEEDRAIAEKGFYLHPSPLWSSLRGSEPPELLPLFPVYSPRDN